VRWIALIVALVALLCMALIVQAVLGSYAAGGIAVAALLLLVIILCPAL
jgi:hypothetical protein